MKHTPGQWKFRRHTAGTYGVYTEDGAGRGSVIATIAAAPYQGDGEANADLIAAAPELLDACELALEAFENNTAIDWNILADAIKKAKGQ